MVRSMRMLVGGVLLAGALSLTACASSLPDAPETVGEDYPAGGIPVGVAWPSDWLEGFVGESDAVGGAIVGLRLEHVDGTWVWRVRSVDPGYDFFGETVTEPERGREALIDAGTLEVLKHRHVDLSDAELAQGELSYYDAAQLSGETYPSPRLIELARHIEDGRLVWTVTTYDTDTGIRSVTSLDAGQVE